VSSSTVKRRVRMGELPVYRDGSRIVRIRETDLRRYVLERVARQRGVVTPTRQGVMLSPGERLWDR
jgi:excisionase family DNA binding protein